MQAAVGSSPATGVFASCDSATMAEERRNTLEGVAEFGAAAMVSSSGMVSAAATAVGGKQCKGPARDESARLRHLRALMVRAKTWYVQQQAVVQPLPHRGSGL